MVLLTVSLAEKLAKASSLLKNVLGSLVSGEAADRSEKGSSPEDIRPFIIGDRTA